MELRQYISFLKRNISVLVICGILGILVGFAAQSWLTKSHTESLIFMTIGAEYKGEVEPIASLNDISQAADAFTETVQGWTKNPEVQKKIETLVGDSVAFSARKQEKQNLILTVTTSKKENIEKASDSVVAVLKDEIAEYNNATKSSFSIASTSRTIQNIQTQGKFTITFGFLVGLFIGFFGVILKEYVYDQVSVESQVEDILGTPIFTSIDKKGEGMQSVELLKTRIGDAKTSLVSTIKLPHGMKEKFHWIDDTELKSDMLDQNMIIAIQLGKTTQSALQKIRMLCTKNIYPVLIR